MTPLPQSDAVKIDPNADPRPRVTAEVKHVGLKAHGLVLWQDQFVMLDSENGALVAVEPASGSVRQIWKVRSAVARGALRAWTKADGAAPFPCGAWPLGG
jgi:hypothetical protein